jgi:hypothetical protein
MIHCLLDASQVVATVDVDGEPYEVCAEAEAEHDRASQQLTVRLSAFLRAERQDHIGETLRPEWLPAAEAVTEHVDAGEAHAVASDVFASWKRRIAAALPT